MNTSEEIKSVVREKYSEIAKTAASACRGSSCGCGCDDDVLMLGESYSKLEGYIPEADLHLGCGIPTDGAGIKDGDVVLDLGSGAGNDAFVARRLVGDSGHVIGVDMTEAMIKRANANNERLGYINIEFRHGEIENLPVESGSIDVVLSNCVLNLVPSKERAFSEIFRVLKPGGHFSVSDIVSTKSLPDKLKKVAELYAGCVSGAMVKEDYLGIITEAGFENVELRREIATPVPQEIYAELTPDEAEAFKVSEPGMLSITVQAWKPAAEKILRVDTTSRNLETMQKLAEIGRSMESNQVSSSGD